MANILDADAYREASSCKNRPEIEGDDLDALATVLYANYEDGVEVKDLPFDTDEENGLSEAFNNTTPSVSFNFKCVYSTLLLLQILLQYIISNVRVFLSLFLKYFYKFYRLSMHLLSSH